MDDLIRRLRSGTPVMIEAAQVIENLLEDNRHANDRIQELEGILELWNIKEETDG